MNNLIEIPENEEENFKKEIYEEIGIKKKELENIKSKDSLDNNNVVLNCKYILQKLKIKKNIIIKRKLNISNPSCRQFKAIFINSKGLVTEKTDDYSKLVENKDIKQNNVKNKNNKQNKNNGKNNKQENNKINDKKNDKKNDENNNENNDENNN